MDRLPWLTILSRQLKKTDIFRGILENTSDFTINYMLCVLIRNATINILLFPRTTHLEQIAMVPKNVMATEVWLSLTQCSYFHKQEYILERLRH